MPISTGVEDPFLVDALFAEFSALLVEFVEAAATLPTDKNLMTFSVAFYERFSFYAKRFVVRMLARI
mgnify:CR=1 FL=1